MKNKTLILKKDTEIIFKVIKRRWYHKYFKKQSGGRALCELSGIILYLNDKGKFYLSCDGLSNVGGIYYFNK